MQSAETALRVRKPIGMRIREYDDTRSKLLIVFLLLIGALAILLFSDMLIFKDGRAGVTEPLSGLELIGIILSGRYQMNLQIGKLSFEVAIPSMAPMFLVLLMAGLAAAAVLVVVLLVKRVDIPKAGFLLFGWCAAAAAVFVMLVTSRSIQVRVGTGAPVPLYQVFETGLTLLIAALMTALAGGILLKLRINRVRYVKNYWFIYLLLIIPTVCMLIFSFFPIILQTVISLKDYKLSAGIWGSQWIGLENFKTIFTSPDILPTVGNSVYLSLLRIASSILPSLILAIVLFDMGREKYRKVVQTIIYIPHFFSWVIIYAIFFAFLSNTGVINYLLKLVMGDGNYYFDFLTNPNSIIPTLVISQIWKEIGWGTILYLAALSNVDPTLYEAATMDGAGALRKLFHITLPGILSVVVFLLILNIGTLFSNGLDQILLFANLAVRDRVNTIELWVYNNGIGKLNYGLASAVGFAQSLIGLILVLLCNKISTKTVGRGLW